MNEENTQPTEAPIYSNSHLKCVVHECSNRMWEGQFVGSICKPCYVMLTTGKDMQSTNFLSRLFRERNVLRSEYSKLRRSLHENATKLLASASGRGEREDELQLTDYEKQWLLDNSSAPTPEADSEAFVINSHGLDGGQEVVPLRIARRLERQRDIFSLQLDAARKELKAWTDNNL